MLLMSMIVLHLGSLGGQMQEDVLLQVSEVRILEHRLTVAAAVKHKSTDETHLLEFTY